MTLQPTRPATFPLESTPATVEAPPSTRRCGSCSACCTVHAVTALEKPINTRCSHLRSGGATGCGIYADRPGECQTYGCAWLRNTVKGLGAGDRPDKLGVIFDLEPALDGQTAMVVAREVRRDVFRLDRPARILAAIERETLLVRVLPSGIFDLKGPWRRVAEHMRLAGESLRAKAAQAKTEPG